MIDMKNLQFIFGTLLLSSVCFASSTINFNRANGVVSSNEYSAEGIINFTNGEIFSNVLEQDNADVPGTIKFTFSTNQTVVNIDYIRHGSYNINNNLGVDFTTLTAYDGTDGTGNIIVAHSLLSSGQLILVGSNNIKSVQITGVYDNFGHFNSFDNLFFYVNPLALPVELTTFEAQMNGNKSIELSWQTANEINNYGFEIERYLIIKNLDVEVQNDWLKVGFIHGHGNSNSPKLYTYIDNLSNECGIVEYRLKQIDTDGTYKYSDIVTVELINRISTYELD